MTTLIMAVPCILLPLVVSLWHALYKSSYSTYIIVKLIRAKTNILNESERITFTMNEYSNILSVFSIKLLA